MKKATKNTFIIILMSILIFALISLIYKNFGQKPIESANTNKNSILPDANNGLDDMLNEILDENVTEVSKEEANNSALTSSDVVEENNGMTPKEAKAIKLAQNKWVEQYKTIEGVTFNVSIQSDGKYLVIVYDTKTTHLIKGYIVDVTTEIVNEK